MINLDGASVKTQDLTLLVGKLLIGSKRGCIMEQTDLLYHHAEYGGDRASSVGCRPKSVMFFCCMSRFRISKFVITETLLNSVIFKTIRVPLRRGRFVVLHLYSIFYGPLKFPLWVNLYQKLLFLAISPHF